MVFIRYTFSIQKQEVKKAGPLSIYQEGRLPPYFFPSTTTRLVTTGNSLVVTRTRYMPL